MVSDLKKNQSSEKRDLLVHLLAWAAGSLDAIGYVGLEHVFTANMTGNLVLLGLAVGQGLGFAALRNVVALAGFIAGVAIERILDVRREESVEWSRGVTRAVFVEGGILALFALSWHLSGHVRAGGYQHLLIALAAMAMGIQSAAVRRLNLTGIATTYMTGTLTSLVSGVVSRLRSPAGSPSGSTGTARKDPRGHHMKLQASVFFVYALAAVFSGLFQKWLPALVPFSPLIAVGLAALGASQHRWEEPPAS